MSIRNLLVRPWRFNELHKSLDGISQKVLTASLRQMEADGIITRTVYAEVPPRVEYALSELGQSMRPILNAMPPILSWIRSPASDAAERAICSAICSKTGCFWKASRRTTSWKSRWTERNMRRCATRIDSMPGCWIVSQIKSKLLTYGGLRFSDGETGRKYDSLG